MKPLEAPRLWLVWAGLGTLLWLALGISDLVSGAPAVRIIAYFVLMAIAVYLFVRALMTILGKTRPDS